MYSSVVLSIALAAAPAPEPESSAAVAVIDKQLIAYNAHALEDFLALFSPDAALFEFPDKPLAKGTAEIRKRYEARFAEPNLHADIVNRVVIGDNVIDRERIRRSFPEGPGVWNVVAIYEVKAGRVARAWFIFGAKVLEKK